MKVLKFDKKGYTQALQKEIDTQIRQAARAWLRAVITQVPVYSGQARASLLPLGRYLRVAIPISPTIEARKQRRYQGAISLGESQGQDAYSFNHEGYVSSFSFSINVPHYLINEFNVGLGQPPLIHPTPWKSLDAGEIAFREYLTQNLQKRIPKISEYIVSSNLNG